jgi:hypothetical protein
MGRTHLTFRLSDEAIFVIAAHQAALMTLHQRDIDRTEALEDIILKFEQKPTFSLSRIFRSKHRLQIAAQNIKPLEVFISAKES